MAFLFGEIFVRGEYTFETSSASPVILDCGANIGMATIFFKWLYPKSIVYAFEPDPKTFQLLKKNIEANKLTDVHLYNAALGEKDGTIDFYTNELNPGSLIMSTNSERLKGQKIEVKMLSLADFITKEQLATIDFMKMDIEGAEIAVFNDLYVKNTLHKINAFALEYHHKIGSARSRLGAFLSVLEHSGFEYQIDAHHLPLLTTGKFQDIIIRGYR